MTQLSARSIRDEFQTHGIAALMDSAARGIHTLPDGMTDHYVQLQAVLDEHSDRFGNLQGWKAEKAAADLMGQIYAAVYGGNADAVLKDHIRPALDQYLKNFRADMDKVGPDATHTDAGALLGRPDDVRQAYVRLVDSYADYHAIRSSWEICRKRNASGMNGTSTIDPDGLMSPLAEVANFPDIFEDWAQAAAGRKPWPWHGTAHHVRMCWLLNNGAEIWLPTGQEQDKVWQKYNPGRRVAA